MWERTHQLTKRLSFCLLFIIPAVLFVRTSDVQAASVSPNCGSWSIVKSPNVPPTSNDDLYGVAAISANDVWAVGEYIQGSTGYTLIEQWNGTNWSIVSSPNLGTSDGLDSVAAISANDIWAVGTSGASQNIQTLIEHWNGSSWSIIASPSPGVTLNSLLAVTAVSSNDVWAVGTYSLGASSFGTSTIHTLIKHWNGTSWSVVSSPSKGPFDQLEGVTAISSNDIWAVGSNGKRALIEHWNGSKWSTVASPHPGKRGFSGLSDIVALSASDIWAVGVGDKVTLIEQWNGTSWSIVSSPNASKSDALSAVTQVPGTGQVWAVGQAHHKYDNTLTEFYC